MDSFHGLYCIGFVHFTVSVSSIEGINHVSIQPQQPRAQSLPYTLTAHNVRVTLPSIRFSFSSAKNNLKCCHHKGHRRSPRRQRFRRAFPIDSNSPSVGTLEVRDVPLDVSLVSEPTISSQPITLPPTCLYRRLRLVLRPRLVS